MKNIKYEHARLVVMLILIAMAMCALNWSCMSAKKATDFLNQNPLYAAEYCADKYPIKTETITIAGKQVHDTLITEGEVIIITDTVLLPGETEYRTVVRQCPPSMSIITHKTDTVIRTKENTARLEACEIRYSDLQKEKSDWEKKAKRRFKIILILIAALAGFWAVKRFTPL